MRQITILETDGMFTLVIKEIGKPPRCQEHLRFDELLGGVARLVVPRCSDGSPADCLPKLFLSPPKKAKPAPEPEPEEPGIKPLRGRCYKRVSDGQLLPGTLAFGDDGSESSGLDRRPRGDATGDLVTTVHVELAVISGPRMDKPRGVCAVRDGRFVVDTLRWSADGVDLPWKACRDAAGVMWVASDFLAVELREIGP